MFCKWKLQCRQTGHQMFQDSSPQSSCLFLLQKVNIGISTQLHKQIVTRFDLVHQLKLLSHASHPDFAGGHPMDVHLRTKMPDMLFEEVVNDSNILLVFVFFAVCQFTEQRDRSLVLSCCLLDKIDIVFFEQPIEVGCG